MFGIFQTDRGERIRETGEQLQFVIMWKMWVLFVGFQSVACENRFLIVNGLCRWLYSLYAVTHIFIVSLSQSSDSNLVIPIMVGWAIERQSMEMRINWRFNKTFVLANSKRSAKEQISQTGIGFVFFGWRLHLFFCSLHQSTLLSFNRRSNEESFNLL